MRFNQASGGPRVGLPSRSTRRTVRRSGLSCRIEYCAAARWGGPAVWASARAGAQTGHPVAQRMHWASCRWSCSLPSPGTPAPGSQIDQARSCSRAADAESAACGSRPTRSGNRNTATRLRATQWRACRNRPSLNLPMRNHYATKTARVHARPCAKAPRPLPAIVISDT